MAPRAKANAKPKLKARMATNMKMKLKVTVKPKSKVASVGKRHSTPSSPKKLQKESPKAGTAASTTKGLHSSAGGSAAPKPARLNVDAERVAREVLRLGQAGQYEAILRVLGDSTEGGGAAVRKAFLKISMLIHPDKLPNFEQATQAFQTLVHAFDRVQVGVNVDSGPLKQKALTRSNEGCFRTEVLCPRCKVPWGAKCEGNPEYYYNFMMQGLRCFSCATCLLEFGCFSAVHNCPWCKRPFEYYPDQYNQKVSCGHADCRKPFGFTSFHASEQAVKHAKEQVRASFDKQSRQEESRNSRAQRAARRGGVQDPAQLAESAFLCGLQDVCPRCGLELEDIEEGAQLRHLRECTNVSLHKAYKDSQQRNAAAREAAKKKEKNQLSHASSAVWSFGGGRVSELYMLSEDAVKKRCKQEGLSIQGGFVTLVGRLANHCAERGDAVGPPAETVPRNLHSLPDAKIAAVVAAHRLRGLLHREEMIEALEELVLCGKSAHSGPKAITGRKKAEATPLALKDKRYLKQQGQKLADRSTGGKKLGGKPLVLPVAKKKRRLDD